MAKLSTDAAELDEMAVQLARVDASSFVEYVLRDEHTGRPVRLAPYHEEWQRLIDENARLVLWSHVESGKTNAVTIGRTLYELHRDAMKRVAIISSGAKQSAKILSSIAKYIKSSPELHRVAPDLVPSDYPGDPWRVDAISVKRPSIAKDPSIVTVSVGAQVLGARWDLVLVDDVLSFENTRTDGERAKIIEWFDSTILSRVVENGKVIVLGSAWDPRDLMHALAARGWPSARYGILDDNGLPRWPDRWSAARIRERRASTSRLEAARQLDCIARSDETSRFDMASVEAALVRGAGEQLLTSIYTGPVDDGLSVVAGVDLAVGQDRRKHDRTAIVVVLLRGRTRHREVIAIESGHWTAPQIVERLVSINRRFRPSEIRVESNGAQMYIHQMTNALDGERVPVRPHTTGGGRHSLAFAVDALATEFARQQWTIRGIGSPEVDALVREVLAFTPGEHTGDRLAALCLARAAADAAESRVGFIGRAENLLRR